mmetsp:Transcript_27589/g.69642  ORF Transcript_27589/g.69642 Transcript_27589/m.69642 type:complete len:159 (-) Transcript_27589:272-748(-)
MSLCCAILRMLSGVEYLLANTDEARMVAMVPKSATVVVFDHPRLLPPAADCMDPTDAEGLTEVPECQAQCGRKSGRTILTCENKQKDAEEVAQVLDYQSGKVLEEAICDLQDSKDSLEKKVQRLEKDMQDLLNHVFRGRFQLFVDAPGGKGMALPPQT